MRDELKELKSAIESLVAVAKNLHVPFDTSQVEKALADALRAAPKPEVDKPARVAEKADEKK